MRKSIIVISYYNERTNIYLERLIHTLKKINADILVVTNSNAATENIIKVTDNVKYLTRFNTGMNIGAWDAGFRICPDYNNYIFLQDECYISNQEFLSRYEFLLSDTKIGMIGESMNWKWDLEWGKIYNTKLNYVIETDRQQKSLTRVEYYLLKMHSWGINPGKTGRHLRSLIWAFRGEVLKSINGFPIGKTKEECIAAEISVSKAVEQKGYLVSQIDEKPFKYIKHKEWREDGSGKL